MSYLGFVNSIEKLRFSILNLDTAQNWTLVVQLTPVNLTSNVYTINGVARIA